MNIKQFRLLFSSLLILCIFNFGESYAAEKKVFAPATSKLKKKSYDNDIVPLTKAECTSLGGEVHSDLGLGICNSGNYCGTVDQNGVKHRVCITAQ